MANEIPGFADHHPSIHPFPYQHPSHPMRNQHQSHDDARGVRRCLSRHNICSSLFPFDCSCPQRLQCPLLPPDRQRCGREGGRVGGRGDGGWPPWRHVSVLLLFNSCLQRLQRPSPPQEGWHCRRIWLTRSELYIWNMFGRTGHAFLIRSRKKKVSFSIGCHKRHWWAELTVEDLFFSPEGKFDISILVIHVWLCVV